MAPNTALNGGKVSFELDDGYKGDNGEMRMPPTHLGTCHQDDVSIRQLSALHLEHWSSPLMSLTISSGHLCDQCKDVTPVISLSTCVATATKISQSVPGLLLLARYHHWVTINTALRGKAGTWQSPNLESEEQFVVCDKTNFVLCTEYISNTDRDHQKDFLFSHT